MLGGQIHWTDSGTDSGNIPTKKYDREQRLERYLRIKKLNQVTSFLGCQVSDWAGSQLIVKSSSGRSEIVDSLQHVWPAIEKLRQIKADPLDENLIFRMENFEKSK